jgi:hypothetical protein
MGSARPTKSSYYEPGDFNGRYSPASVEYGKSWVRPGYSQPYGTRFQDGRSCSRFRQQETPWSDRIFVILTEGLESYNHQAIGDFTRVAMQRRAPSDEQEKRLSQNETGRRRSKFSGARKTPVGNSARLRSLLALSAWKARILIWQGFGGARKSLFIRNCVNSIGASRFRPTPLLQIGPPQNCLTLLGDRATILTFLFDYQHNILRISQDQ